MKKQVIIIAIVIFLISAGLTLLMYNPLNTEKNKFIGTWKSFEPIDTLTYEFFSNGTIRATSFIDSYKNVFV